MIIKCWADGQKPESEMPVVVFILLFLNTSFFPYALLEILTQKIWVRIYGVHVFWKCSHQLLMRIQIWEPIIGRRRAWDKRWAKNVEVTLCPKEGSHPTSGSVLDFLLSNDPGVWNIPESTELANVTPGVPSPRASIPLSDKVILRFC